MIAVEKLGYSFPQKDLYKDISFTIEDGQHCALIGSNGTGKTTLIDILMNREEYLYDGKIKMDEGRIGYVSQFVQHEKNRDITVYDYLSEDFIQMQGQIEAICKDMETAEDMEEVFERYQQCLDEFQAVDGDSYETNIQKQLKLSGLQQYKDLSIAALSGGEYKLVQIIRQMLRLPNLLIMDEPDVFLDFNNLSGLKELINSYKGTMIVITHNRYLLNHCFNKILHLENMDLQEFDGSYIEYNFMLLQTKIELQEKAAIDAEEIARQEKVVERLRAEATKIDSATRGRTLKARASYLERLRAKQVKEPFLQLEVPEIYFPEVEEEYLQWAKLTSSSLDGKERSEVDASEIENQDGSTCAEMGNMEIPEVLQVKNYQIAFEDVLLESVSFALKGNEKVALVGANGTGKTTLLREIVAYASARTQGEDMCADLSFDGEMGDGKGDFKGADLSPDGEEKADDGELNSVSIWIAPETKVAFMSQLYEELPETASGGEKNLFMLRQLEKSGAQLLLLDEPTSHLDIYAQQALEQAVREYKGAVLMVSHDFYSIANCVDHVLYVENRTIRRMSGRAFRKMVYKNHFDVNYLELEQKKKDLENRILSLLKGKNYEEAKNVCNQLELVVRQMV